MKRLFALSTLYFILLTSCIRPFKLTGAPTEGAMPTSVLGTAFTPTATNPTPEQVSPTPSEIPTPALATPSANQFGVIISGPNIARPEIVGAAKDLGAGWVRLNLNLGMSTQDYTLFLASGINVVLTISNQDPSNIVTTYGTLREWPNAGFPFKSETQYQQQIRTVLEPALPYLSQGRLTGAARMSNIWLNFKRLVVAQLKWEMGYRWAYFTYPLTTTIYLILLPNS